MSEDITRVIAKMAQIQASIVRVNSRLRALRSQGRPRSLGGSGLTMPGETMYETSTWRQIRRLEREADRLEKEMARLREEKRRLERSAAGQAPVTQAVLEKVTPEVRPADSTPQAAAPTPPPAAEPQAAPSTPLQGKQKTKPAPSDDVPWDESKGDPIT